MSKRLLEITSLTLISLAALALGGLLAFRVQRGNLQIVSAIKTETSVKSNPLKSGVDFSSKSAEKLARVTGSSIAEAKETLSSPVVDSANVTKTEANPNDSDSDGLSDELEDRYGSNPFSSDTDGDGYEDGQEVKNGYSPTSPATRQTYNPILTTDTSQTISNTNCPTCQSNSVDTDGDGLLNSDEAKYGSNPNNPDTDLDGYLDGIEVKNGYSPTSSTARLPDGQGKPIQSLGQTYNHASLQGASTTENINELSELLKSTGYSASLPQVADAKIKVYANHNEYFDLVNAAASGAESQITQATTSLSNGNLASVKILADQFNQISNQLAATPAPAELASDHKKLVAVFKGYGQTLNKLSSVTPNSPTAQTDAIQILAEIALYDQEAKNIFSKFK